ncbi:hypothetical protein [Carboxylicivirga sp. N1Y90]|uniref:hypothetical protein n=1 Tax=Carboxylicivirga fragile TaxID=3417571 RepID=UPI003D328909|nr:hypothetical protein [Marinilabiliaceae bacterium N1Y90]
MNQETKENLRVFVELLKNNNNYFDNKKVKVHLKDWNILSSEDDINKIKFKGDNKSEVLSILREIEDKLRNDFINDPNYNYLVDLRIRNSVGSITELVSMPLKVITPSGEIQENSFYNEEKVREESFRLRMIDCLVSKDEVICYKIAEIIKSSYISVGMIDSLGLVTVYVKDSDSINLLENEYKKQIIQVFIDILGEDGLSLDNLVYKEYPSDFFKSIAYDNDGSFQIKINELRSNAGLINDNTEREINIALGLIEQEQYLSALRLLLIIVEEITDEIILRTESWSAQGEIIGLRKKIALLSEKYNFKMSTIYFTTDIVDIRNSFVHASINLKDQTSLLVYVNFVMDEMIKIINIK